MISFQVHLSTRLFWSSLFVMLSVWLEGGVHKFVKSVFTRVQMHHWYLILKILLCDSYGPNTEPCLTVLGTQVLYKMVLPSVMSIQPSWSLSSSLGINHFIKTQFYLYLRWGMTYTQEELGHNFAVVETSHFICVWDSAYISCLEDICSLLLTIIVATSCLRACYAKERLWPSVWKETKISVASALWWTYITYILTMEG
jgi:hypothetical protein